MDEIIAKYDPEVILYVQMMKDSYDAQTNRFTDSDYMLHLYCEMQNEAEEDLGISAEAFCEIWSAFEEEDMDV